MPNVDDAQALAGAGWEILPLHSKIPVTPNGVLNATTDPETISAWWARGEHNIGARVPVSSLVLDVDPQNGGSFQELEEIAGVCLPETLTVHSGRNTGGQHRYYVHPGGALTSRNLPKGIDLKTSTGYCVMPPSIHSATGLPYTWEVRPQAPLPREVIALLQPPRPARVHTPAKTQPEQVEKLLKFVESLADGTRNAGLFWAACRAVENGESDEVFALLILAGISVGLTPVEASRTIESARRRGGVK